MDTDLCADTDMQEEDEKKKKTRKTANNSFQNCVGLARF